MPNESAAYLVAVVCYGLATGVAIRLRDDLAVPTAAALAPAAAALSTSTDPLHPVLVFAIGPLVSLVTLGVRRSPVLEMLSHVGLFLALTSAASVLSGANGLSEMGTLAFVVLGALAYSLVEVLRQKATFRGRAHISADFRMWALLQTVIVCAAGLTALVVSQLSAAAFVAMAAVLALTKREFEGFALSRTALDQTVRALAGLQAHGASRPDPEAVVTRLSE